MSGGRPQACDFVGVCVAVEVVVLVSVAEAEDVTVSDEEGVSDSVAISLVAVSPLEPNPDPNLRAHGRRGLRHVPSLP